MHKNSFEIGDYVQTRIGGEGRITAFERPYYAVDDGSSECHRWFAASLKRVTPEYEQAVETLGEDYFA